VPITKFPFLIWLKDGLTKPASPETTKQAFLTHSSQLILNCFSYKWHGAMRKIQTMHTWISCLQP